MEEKGKIKVFLDWLYRYRLIATICGVVLLAVVFVSILYISTFVQTSKIDFLFNSNPGSDGEKPSEVVKKFNKVSDLPFEFTYTYDKTKAPIVEKTNKEGVVTTPGKAGYYKFSAYYDELPSKYSSISVTFLAHANWIKDFNFIAGPVSLSAKPTNDASLLLGNVTINYTTPLPKYALLIKVKNPSLYIKVECAKRNGAGSDIFYLKDTHIFLGSVDIIPL
ncbi:MAG: hypothetical protein LBV51_05360 [Acholeplasmatales bacterium]|jgi:hypothetical protein|nr:hypothetical protein [Acholeplasmatales bacterium]